jgi:DNA-binding CsgD family transcriptional regulator/PAS domain-containing protein
MTNRQALFDRIIETVYDSVTDLGAQRRLLADTGALLNSHCANLRIARRGEPVHSTWHGFGDYPSQFFDRGVAENEWRKSLVAVRRSMDVGVHFGSEGIKHSELIKTLFYEDHCKPFGIDYSLGIIFRSHQDGVGVLGVYRGRERGDYDPQEGRLLGKLIPHLARAASFADRLRRAELLRSSEERAWDLIPWGTLLLASDGRILFANRSAEEILRQGDGLKACYGRVVTAARADMTRLKVLLRRASTPTDGPRTGGAMPVLRGGGRRPLQLWVMPLPRAKPSFPQLEPLSSICVLLFDPDREVVPPTESLKALHGLTHAEAELVAGFLRGERLEDYAERAGITLNTARTHLKSVFGKTDTHRQAELIRLLSSVPLIGDE